MGTWIRLSLFAVLLIAGLVLVLWPQHQAAPYYDATAAPPAPAPRPHVEPAPFTGSAAVADVIGAWYYTDGPTVIDIAFYRDGTFQQNVAVVLVQTGRWELQGNHLILHDLLIQVDGKWVPHEQVTWDVIASAQHRGHSALYGGISADRASYQELVKR